MDQDSTIVHSQEPPYNAFAKWGLTLSIRDPRGAITADEVVHDEYIFADDNEFMGNDPNNAHLEDYYRKRFGKDKSTRISFKGGTPNVERKKWPEELDMTDEEALAWAKQRGSQLLAGHVPRLRDKYAEQNNIVWQIKTEVETEANFEERDKQ